MSYLEHEKHIKESLQDYSPIVDENALWGAVSHAIPQKKRRVPFWISWTVAASVAMGLLLLLIANVESANQNNNINITNKNNILKTDNKEVDSKIYTSENKTKAVSTNQSSATKINPIRSNTKTLKQSNDNNNTTTSASIKQVETKQQTPQSPVSIIINTQPMANVSTVIQKNTSTKKGNLITGLNPQTSSLGENIDINPLMSSIDLLNYNRAEMALLDDQIIIPVKEKTTPRWSIGVSTGIAKINSTMLPTNTNSENQSISDLNNRYTQDLPSFTSMVHLNYQISNRLRLNTGLQHTLSTQRILLQDINTTSTQANGVTQVVIDDLGNETTTISNLNSYATTEYNTQWHSYLQTYSIPLGITYDIMTFRRFSMGLGAGLRLDLLHRDRGAIIDVNYKLNKYDIGDASYDRSMALGYTMNIPLNYQLTDRCLITMTAAYQSFKNKINSNLSLTQHSTGVAIGVHYQINK